MSNLPVRSPEVAEVFISYRRESDAHCERIRVLAGKLEIVGFQVIFDEFAKTREFSSGAPPRGWDHWSILTATTARSILAIASPGWFGALNKLVAVENGLGAAAEAETVLHRLNRQSGVNDFLTIGYFDAEDLADLPPYLDKCERVHLTDISQMMAFTRWLLRSQTASVISGTAVTVHREERLASVELANSSLLNRIIYKRVPVQGVLNFDEISNPYADLYDATGGVPPRIHGFCWFPHSQYIQSRAVQPFTPVSIICCPDPSLVFSKLNSILGESRLSKIQIPPRNLRNEEKQFLLSAMGQILDDCFEVAVTFPRLILEVGHAKPELAYQAMVSGFLLPFLRLHNSYGLERFHLEISDIGKLNPALLTSVTQVFKACFTRKSGAPITFTNNNIQSITMCCVARLLAWSVAALHNSGNSQWIDLLREGAGKRGRDSARMEESL